MEWAFMVVAIVLITTAGSVIRKRDQNRARVEGPFMTASETNRMRDEVKALKERVAVLERLATDTNGSLTLDREIEKLRSGDRV